jgi:hypothetical protein
MPLDDQLLDEYIKTFYGYGNYEGDWWLIGMEEGSGGTDDEIRTRLRLWNERGRKELEDVDMFRSSPDLAKWFTPRPAVAANVERVDSADSRRGAASYGPGNRARVSGLRTGTRAQQQLHFGTTAAAGKLCRAVDLW